MKIRSRINQLIEESFASRLSNIPRSFQLVQEALDLSREYKFPDCEALANNKIGLYYMIVGEYEKAISHSEKALAYFSAENSAKGIADANYNIASVHYKSNNFHLGLKYLLESLKLYRKLEDHYNESRVLKSMGTIYEYFGDHSKAVESYEMAIQAARLVNAPNLESNAYNPLSGLYLNDGDISKAMQIIEKSIALKKETNDIRGLAFALYGRGKVHAKTGKYDLAESDFKESLTIHVEMGDHLGESMSLQKLGALYMEAKRLDEARDTLEKALELSNRLEIFLVKFKSYYLLYDLSKREGKSDEALFYLEQYLKTKEEVLNSETYQVIKSYESITKIEALQSDAIAQKEKSKIIEAKNIELDSFFYRISHDLKGPISSLIGLHNLMKKESTGEMANYLNMNEKQINRLNTIIMELINLTQMSHSERKIQKIDFNQIVHDCIESYTYLPNFDSIIFEVEIEDNLNFQSEWVIVNTIVQNLIENGIKYSYLKKPRVGVFITDLQNKISIVVKDNGCGIPEEHQGKVFDMFYRANTTTEGSGLGLFILKRAVERLGGEVGLKSRVGEETVFTVDLPR